MAVTSTNTVASKPSFLPARKLLLAVMIFAALGSAPPLGAQEKTINLDDVEMRLATLPEGTAGMMAEYVPEGNGVVYLLGGYRTDDGSGALELSRNVWVYDPALDELSSLGTLEVGLALAGHAYVPEENTIYLFGGLEEPNGSISESNAGTSIPITAA